MKEEVNQDTKQEVISKEYTTLNLHLHTLPHMVFFRMYLKWMAKL